MMKHYAKLLLFTVLFAVSLMLGAQSFSVAELLDLSGRDQQFVNQRASSKGYVYAGVMASDLSTNYIFDYGNNARLFLIYPNFESDMKLLGWEFYSPAIYDAMKYDIVSNNYQLVNSESRSGGRYLSLYYSKPGIDIILTLDNTWNYGGVYRIAIRSLNMEKYAERSGGYQYPMMQDYLYDMPRTIDRPKPRPRPHTVPDTPPKRYETPGLFDIPYETPRNTNTPNNRGTSRSRDRY